MALPSGRDLSSSQDENNNVSVTCALAQSTPKKANKSGQAVLPEGVINGHILIGDSFLRRVAEQELKIRSSTTRVKSSGRLRVGHCVGGDTTGEVATVLANYKGRVDKAIVMIGTNDVLQNRSDAELRHELQSVARSLSARFKKSVFLLRVPLPLHSAGVADRLAKFKEVAKDVFDNYNSIEVIDSREFVVNKDGNCKRCLYETTRSVDVPPVHLSAQGTQVLYEHLVKLTSSKRAQENCKTD